MSTIGIDGWEATAVNISAIEIELSASMTYDVSSTGGSPVQKETGSGSYSLIATFEREDFSHGNPITANFWQAATGLFEYSSDVPQCFRSLLPSILNDNPLYYESGTFTVTTESFLDGVSIGSSSASQDKYISCAMTFPNFTLSGNLSHSIFPNWQSDWPLFGISGSGAITITDGYHLNGGTLTIELDPLPEPDPADWTVTTWDRTVTWTVTVS